MAKDAKATAVVSDVNVMGVAKLFVDQPQRGAPVLGLGIALEELAQDMDAIQDRDGHEEDGDHGTHDMEGEPRPSQKTHGPDHAQHRHKHGGHDQNQLAEEVKHQQEDQHAGQWRQQCHLYEHVPPELLFRQRQPGQKVASVAGQGVD
ncbi:MAG: hypothetical protein COA56_02100 [Dehalococcoidia bacterium]|nr:MAG: hypothetical protein COA56_02100 [Dehalococcoidia bacterium]PKB81416.1 MAG: hypothetical protein BZY84_06440 [SAR202 cluster bacterium MP-SInd-SRR3963457-G1]